MQREHAHRYLLPARQQRVVLALQQCSAVRRDIKTVVGAIVRGIVRQEPHVQRLPGARGNAQIQGSAAGGGNAIERTLHACEIDGGRAVIASVTAYRRRGAEQGHHAIAIPGVGPGQPG